MVYSGVQKDLAFCHKPVGRVKALSMQLRRQFNLKVTLAARFIDKRSEYQRTQALAPIGPPYSKPADMPVWQQTAGSRWFVAIVSHNVDAFGIVLVQLKLGRHVLLVHEHLVSDG